jgi:hypothetical protein
MTKRKRTKGQTTIYIKLHRFDFSFHTCMFLLNIVVDADRVIILLEGVVVVILWQLDL